MGSMLIVAMGKDCIVVLGGVIEIVLSGELSGSISIIEWVVLAKTGIIWIISHQSWGVIGIILIILVIAIIVDNIVLIIMTQNNILKVWCG